MSRRDSSSNAQKTIGAETLYLYDTDMPVPQPCLWQRLHTSHIIIINKAHPAPPRHQHTEPKAAGIYSGAAGNGAAELYAEQHRVATGSKRLSRVGQGY